MEEKYVDVDGNEWTIARSAQGWFWRQEIATTGRTRDSVARFGCSEDCLQDARSHGLVEGYPMGGDCVRRHDGLWRWRVIGSGGKVTAESPGVYPNEEACRANACANAPGWDLPIVDESTASADAQLQRLIELVGDAVANTGGILRTLPAGFENKIGAGSLLEAVRRVSEAIDLGLVSADALGSAVMLDPETGHPQQMHTNIVLTARGERRFMSIKARRRRKGVPELVDHVGRIVTETGCPVPQIDGHSGSSLSQEDGFATSVMNEALDTGLIVAFPDEVMEFYGGSSALLQVDLTESGWALYGESSPPHLAPEALDRDQVETKTPVSAAIPDQHSPTGIHIHANEVNIGAAVGGDVTGDVQGSRDSSVPSPEPLWKRHRRKTIWGSVVLAALAVLAIAGEEFVERAAANLYDRIFPTQGNEDIAVEVQGFNSTVSTDRRVIAHNYGEKVGILMPDILIIVSDENGEELTRLSKSLITKLDAAAEPFTLSGKKGATYYLGQPDSLPHGAKHCVLQYQVKRSAHDSRTGESPQFECNG